ncbi:MAG: branched-chain amino acid ABC transporter permease [Gammaproteobacteria bacterium]|nr:branched-chain amino acid ABC transporter permease [Gammaproteobacteria bacterium]MBU1442153.1 branched-chain amino acid ABC transporter permease [Gammaproteobacteria bacterium]MBU2285223.1 branched-chain amino acid ABC transporter permease [Gammaproteobacteria bacterium]MBU2410841.1 branched-chain amino acid ABC transporter permease [Gammaproteobacteria bacterium]
MSLAFWFYLVLWITLASGLNIMGGFTGYLPFGYVAFYGIGAYAMAIGVRKLGLPWELGLALAAVVGLALSLAFARTLLLRGIYFSIVSLALAVICRLLIANMPSEYAGGSFGITLGLGKPQVAYYVMLTLMVATLVAVTWLSQSRLGMALRAIRDDADTAETMGIDIARARLKAWMLSAVIAALTGAIEAWYTNIVDTETAFNLLVSTKAIIYAVAGGLGTVIGPVVGVISMLAVDNLIWENFPVLNVFLLGLAIVLLMLFLPRGIVGTLIWRMPRLRRYLF